MNNDRDQFLTEAMGECWHEPGEQIITCGKCGEILRGLAVGRPGGGSKIAIERKYNFDDWTGFGALWEWAQEQDRLVGLEIGLIHQDSSYVFIPQKLIHPSRFADVVYQFLRVKK